MDLVVIAQIITGLATLIVALVLVFQLRKQNQQLELQHKDADIQISMLSENILEKLYNFGNYDDEFISVIYKGRLNNFEKLNDEEKWKFNSWAGVVHRRIAIDWRLGRANNFAPAFKLAYKNLFEYKSALDIYKKIWRNILLTMDDINGKGLTNIADEVYEEITGEKLKN